MQTSDNTSAGWADRPETRQRIRYVLYAVCALLFLADFVVHRHIYVDIERVPVFYAIYGFIALIVTVQLSKGLRRIVGRKEEYYDDVEIQEKKKQEDDHEL